MKKLLLGVGLGIVVELLISTVLSSFLMKFSSTRVFESWITVVLPILGAILITLYLFLAKRPYKLMLGVLVGIILCIIGLAFLLAGA